MDIVASLLLLCVGAGMYIGGVVLSGRSMERKRRLDLEITRLEEMLRQENEMSDTTNLPCPCCGCGIIPQSNVYVPHYQPQPLSLVERFEQLILEKAKLEEELSQSRQKVDELERSIDILKGRRE